MLNDNFVVTKSNALIEASYKLNLNEQRIVLSCISQLDGRKPLPRDNKFWVTAEDFSESFGMNINKAYEALHDAANQLYERDIRTFDEYGKNKKRVRWVYKVEYEAGQGRVMLAFSPDIAPYLTKLHKQFTTYQLKRVAGLRSAHSIRIFEMLQQFSDTGILRISLDDFKDRLELGNQYSRFYDIKRRIIEPAIKELHNKSGLIIEWDTKKKSRAVVGLEFRFKDDEQMSLDLEN